MPPKKRKIDPLEIIDEFQPDSEVLLHYIITFSIIFLCVVITINFVTKQWN